MIGSSFRIKFFHLKNILLHLTYIRRKRKRNVSIYRIVLHLDGVQLKTKEYYNSNYMELNSHQKLFWHEPNHTRTRATCNQIPDFQYVFTIFLCFLSPFFWFVIEVHFMIYVCLLDKIRVKYEWCECNT